MNEPYISVELISDDRNSVSIRNKLMREKRKTAQKAIRYFVYTLLLIFALGHLAILFIN